MRLLIGSLLLLSSLCVNAQSQYVFTFHHEEKNITKTVNIDEKILVFVGDIKTKGRINNIDHESISIGGKAINVDDITQVKSRRKYQWIGYILVPGGPLLTLGQLTNVADGSAVGPMLTGMAVSGTGVYLLTKRRHDKRNWRFYTQKQ